MILPTAYLGPITYYQTLLSEREVMIEQWETFPKRTYRNRCQIAGVNGVQMLTIPVEKCDHKQLTKDVKIVYQQPWQQQHWMALRSAYEHSPFFGYLEDAFRPHYEKQVEYLMDWNELLQEEVLRLMGQMGMDSPVACKRTTEWQGPWDERGWGDEMGMEPYYQVFANKHGFQTNLSIVDLLFNTGAESLLYLKR